MVSGTAPRDYKARYPLDPYGQEMSAMARIWSIYLDEAADFDANMLAEWLDVLLVFGGLFAVLTTFVVQTSQNIQPDYNQASAFLRLKILKATTSNGPQISIPSSPTEFFSLSRSDQWLNGLWFVSLTLSPITALVAVLVKQWLHQYVAIVSDSSARDRARIRHMRYAGLQTWQVPMIIGMLHVLLHVSLALFFAGLSIFLFSLPMKVAWLVSVMSATYTAYVIALILPLIHPYCPYKVYAYFLAPVVIKLLCMPHHISPSLLPRYQEWLKDSSTRASPTFPTLEEIEHAYLQEYAMQVAVVPIVDVGGPSILCSSRSFLMLIQACFGHLHMKKATGILPVPSTRPKTRYVNACFAQLRP
ncbi:hypothetical protein ARMGADRAFT_937399 [Armillaria gallica]|uniref:DUF6535 domain-containing protein n=1 Tax=Armillaria gallica TaxID=47427 RepID=A0A2H3DJ93_ARMGA|nr:hypothetical protein ARMGADRAFT_937399 [Armillaria gallica]